MMDDSRPPAGLDRNMERIKAESHVAALESWGGATFDAHTGQRFTNSDNKFVLSVKPPGTRTVSVPEGASRDELDGAIDQARERFAEQLAIRGGALGVFHDDDLKTIDIDPVIVVGTVGEVETIGAYTHAIGGAYHFRSGDGFWPPHVVD